MAALSRFVVTDTNLHVYEAVIHVRAGISLYGNGWSMQSKPNSPLAALLAPSSIILDSGSFLSTRNSKVKCKAAANVSGDSPTPKGMNQYERIIETSTTLFPVWVTLGAIVGIYKPAAVKFSSFVLLLVNNDSNAD
ncbi:hypothetical protein V6Z11_D13G239200 [Gossypium hirsutum]